MPRTSLCNRLVVTSTRWNPPFPGAALSCRCLPRARSRLGLGGSPTFHAPIPKAELGDRFWPAEPRATEQLVLLRSAAIELRPIGKSGVPPYGRMGFVGPTRPASLESLTPSVASRSLLRHPEATCGRQDRLSPELTKSPASPTQSVFHRQVPPSLPGFRRARTARAATRTPGSPPGTELPTCFHAPSHGALDPTACWLLARAEGPHAACRLLQRRIPRARQRLSDLRQRLWQATAHRMTAPLSGRRQPSFLRSGVTWL